MRCCRAAQLLDAGPRPGGRHVRRGRHDLVVVRPQLSGQGHGEGLLIRASLEAAMAAEVVRFALKLADQSGHVGVSKTVC